MPPRLPRSAHLSLAPVQTVPHQGRLDLRHVHDREVLAGAGASASAAPELTDDPRFADADMRAARTATS